MQVKTQIKTAPIQHFSPRTLTGAFILAFGAFVYAGQFAGSYGQAIAQRLLRVVDAVTQPSEASPSVTPPIVHQLEA